MAECHALDNRRRNTITYAMATYDKNPAFLPVLASGMQYHKPTIRERPEPQAIPGFDGSRESQEVARNARTGIEG